MADDQNVDLDLDISDEDAEKLLEDPETDSKADRPESLASDSDQLGDAGKRAIEAMKRERNAARKEAAEARAKAKQYEDANKTESERLQEALMAHQIRADKAEAILQRRTIAETRAPEWATTADIQKVAKKINGDTDEELEADADELYEWIKDRRPAEPKAKTPSRPKERLRGGGDPDDEPEETDPRKLAALIPRRR